MLLFADVCLDSAILKGMLNVNVVRFVTLSGLRAVIFTENGVPVDADTGVYDACTWNGVLSSLSTKVGSKTILNDLIINCLDTSEEKSLRISSRDKLSTVSLPAAVTR